MTSVAAELPPALVRAVKTMKREREREKRERERERELKSF
jgi:hypothetical protein